MLKQLLRRGVLLTALIGLLGGWVAGPVQAQEAALTPLQKAFEDGDAGAVLAGAADRVQIALLGQSKLYSRAQATYVLKDFFRRYPAKTFTFQHNAREDGNWFATGWYHHEQTEQPLHVYVRLRLKEEQWELLEVRIKQRRGE